MSIEALKTMISSHVEIRLRSFPEELIDDIYAFSLYMDIDDVYYMGN